MTKEEIEAHPWYKHCLAQLNRLSCQSYYARFAAEESFLQLLAETLIEEAESQHHIARMVDVWLKRTKDMLHPSNIADLANDTAQHEKGALPGGCEECRGLPYVIVEGGARRCTCPRGKGLARRERERKEKRVG